MLSKKIVLATIILLSLYSVETNAKTIVGNQCTLGLLPLKTILGTNTKKDEIVKAFEDKGYYVSVLSTPEETKSVEYISEASIDCFPTYFGIMATTSVRILEASSLTIVAKASSPTSMDLFTCKINLLSTIQSLPDCQIK